MNCIVDTHYLMWSLDDPGKIKPVQARILLDSNSTKFVSKVSLWEIALKFSLGKLDLKGLTPEDIRVKIPLPKMSKEPFLKIWEHEVFRLLLNEKRITKEDRSSKLSIAPPRPFDYAYACARKKQIPIS